MHDPRVRLHLIECLTFIQGPSYCLSKESKNNNIRTPLKSHFECHVSIRGCPLRNSPHSVPHSVWILDLGWVKSRSPSSNTSPVTTKLKHLQALKYISPSACAGDYTQNNLRGSKVWWFMAFIIIISSRLQYPHQIFLLWCKILEFGSTWWNAWVLVQGPSRRLSKESKTINIGTPLRSHFEYHVSIHESICT